MGAEFPRRGYQGLFLQSTCLSYSSQHAKKEPWLPFLPVSTYILGSSGFEAANCLSCGFRSALTLAFPQFPRGISTAMRRPVKTIENVFLNEPKGICTATRTSTKGPGRRVLRVWLVDDNAALRELFAHLLTKQSGIRCTRQFPSAEALLIALAEEKPPDVILLDVNLGGQSGLSAIRPIKKLAPTVKVLMLTMFSNGHYEMEAFESGASGFLLKSYGLDEIAQWIHEADRNPGAPGLFPNMAMQKSIEVNGNEAGAAGLAPSFSLVSALRRLCGVPRKQTVS
ncbi:MAG: response regulator transcription factor [Verrucomicrobia bacterium]|nr:response regulator transcription factor [Verrucomicrobiota bacterium]